MIKMSGRDMLLVLLMTSLILQVRDATAGAMDFGACDFKNMRCSCGSSLYVVKVKECTFFYKWRMSCKPCNGETEETVCGPYKNCAECELDKCKTCPKGRYGDTCYGVCTCQNGGKCDPVTGTCTCVPPFKGENCEISNFTIKAAPTCLIPEINPDSVFIPSQEPTNDEFAVGTVLNFLCVKGAILVGKPNITCTSRGHWSRPPPYCDKACKLTSLSPYITVSLRSSAKSRIRIDQLAVQDDKVPTGTVITFGCSSNFFRLIGPPKTYCTSRGTWSENNFPKCEAMCGLPGKPRSPYIINGTTAAKNAYPWVVSLYYLVDGKEEFKCGSTIISEDWLITAAHCVTHPYTKTRVNESMLMPIAGKHTIENKELFQQELKVSNVFVHHNYNEFTLDYDIALLQLTFPIVYNEQVLPVCLPGILSSTVRIRQLNAGMIGKAIGWGYVNETSQTLATELQEATFPVVAKKVCDDAFKEDGIIITENMFCIGNGTGLTGVCDGDSGGPFLTQEDTGNGLRYYLRGLVSWGSIRGCAVEGMYSAFTNVEMFSKWIEDMMMD